MNRADNLRPCLSSIREHTAVSHEVLVVAYMFEKAALAQLKEEFPEVNWIESRELRGFAENNNLALARARGRFCFILNDDTEFTVPVIDTLVTDFGLLPQDAAIVSPKLLNTDGTLQLCGRPARNGRHYLLQQWHLWREQADNVSGMEPVCGGIYRTAGICGAAFLIRTEVFRELGWFDERYFFTPEDMALSTLAIANGYGVYVDSTVAVTHKWRTTASRLSPAVRPAAVRGNLMFFSRGSNFRYLLLGAGIWPAEFSKRIKARLQGRMLDYLTSRNISRNIFTRRTPKEIFTRYYL